MARKITEQGIFTFVYRFLTKQGRLARGGAACLYRVQSDGKMQACAAGCLLTDDEANGLDNAPNGTFRALARDHLTPPRFDAHVEFISELQGMHDRCHSISEWQNQMQSFAALKGLTVPNV